MLTSHSSSHQEETAKSIVNAIATAIAGTVPDRLVNARVVANSNLIPIPPAEITEKGNAKIDIVTGLLIVGGTVTDFDVTIVRGMMSDLPDEIATSLTIDEGRAKTRELEAAVGKIGSARRVQARRGRSVSLHPI